MSIRVAVNGLGRIGRCVVRAIYELGYNKEIELVAINTPNSIEQSCYLLKYDSIHGKAPMDIFIKDGLLNIDGRYIKYTSESNIEKINWDGIDIVLECSGKFNKRSQAEKHITSGGARKVIISAPASDVDANIVYGVNHNNLNNEHNIISITSCTTNAFAPLVYLLHHSLGIKSGFMTTVHAYTNDQNLLDNSHKKDFRRARAAALSMIPTSTGAAKMVSEIIPQLKDKIDGVAIRVPIANVSMIDFSFVSVNKTTVEEINEVFKKSVNNNILEGILKITDEPLISSDFIHDSASAIVDLMETKVIDNNLCRIVAWYDNEWGYSARLIDVAKLAGNFI